MTVDILDHGKNKKEVLSNTNQVYFPKGAYISLDEKLIGKLFGVS